MVTKKNILTIVFFILSAILLTVIQPPFNLPFLAWIAIVPFVFACLNSNKIWQTALIAYFVSLVYWLGNVYWLEPITFLGWFMFGVYIALYWPLIVICLKFCLQRRVPLWLSLPILFVGAEAFEGIVFRGFAWRYLGHSQYSNITIIQIADIFGAGGISFLVAMVNGLICDLAPATWGGVRPPQTAAAKFASIVFTVVALTATIFYGRFRINQTPAFVESGPKIGIIQPDVPVEIRNNQPPEVIFNDLSDETRKCMQAGNPLLVIWPETMVEAVLSDSVLKYAPEDDVAKRFHDALLGLSSEGAYLLVGSFSGDVEKVDDKLKLVTSYNTAFLYEPNQPAKRQYYYKIHLVPFGEYIPFKDTIPFLNKFLLKLTPYNFDYTLNAGQEYTIFRLNESNKTYHFGVMICYEDTVPAIARKLTLDENNRKKADWLVNISNDGWFVRQSDGKVLPSTELVQHTAICVFRAIENRVPVVRCVNTGISCFIDSIGRIHNDYITGDIEKNALDRTGKAGWFVDSVLMDKRVTFFSQSGQNLEIVCGVCLIFTAVMSIYKNVRRNSNNQDVKS